VINDGDLTVAPGTINENGSTDLSGSFTDPGTGDTHTVTIDWGDGSTDTVLNLGAGVTNFGPVSHQYLDDNPSVTASDSYNITVTVEDDDGDSDDAGTSVTVNNVNPVLGAVSVTPEPSSEGSSVTASASFTDVGTLDTHTCSINWGDGSPVAIGTVTQGAGSGTCGGSHTYVDEGSYLVTVTVTDDDSGSHSNSASHTVNNAAPVVATPESNSTTNEGSPASASAHFSDAGTGDTHTCSINWGDGTIVAGEVSENAGSGTCSGTHTYVDNGSYTVTFTITDDDGGVNSGSIPHVVNNVAPTATLSNNGPINEGGSATVSFSGQADPSSADTSAGFHYAFSCTNGLLAASDYGNSGTSASTSCPFAENGSYTVKGRIIDKDNGYTEYTTTVVVNNVNPVINSFTGPAGPLALGTLTTVTATFTVAGVLDTHTCAFAWDDGTPNTSVPATYTPPGSGQGTCSATHTFANPGVYSVVVTVRDDDGGTATRALDQMFVVIFDPDGGFVTGGGWIMSPALACTLTPGCASQTGKANFGFNSKYKKGSNVPDGQTQFQFHAGDLNFHSSSYDVGSLVVSGHKAQYKGVGTINGVAGYKFVLTAYDGDVSGGGGVDKFRMKITRIVGGEVVYDNRRGLSDDIDNADPMAISGGSIVIHKGK
jgi:hypothetical protein